MSKTKVLGWIAIALFVGNILWAGFAFWTRNAPRGEGPRKLVIEKLGFDAAQVEAYDALIGQHRKHINTLDREMRHLKTQLYGNLSHPAHESTKDSLIQALGTLQTRIEQTHYQHFQDIRKLCKPHQQKAFADFTQEIVTLFKFAPKH